MGVGEVLGTSTIFSFVGSSGPFPDPSDWFLCHPNPASVFCTRYAQALACLKNDSRLSEGHCQYITYIKVLSARVASYVSIIFTRLKLYTIIMLSIANGSNIYHRPTQRIVRFDRR